MVDWNRSNDTYLYGLVTGLPLTLPSQLPPVKNELLRGEIDLDYELSRNLVAGVSYWFEDYQVEDFALGPTTLTGIALPPVQEGQPVVATNALLLGYLVSAVYRPRGIRPPDLPLLTAAWLVVVGDVLDVDSERPSSAPARWT